MNSFFHITSKDPERQCHFIKPFTSSKLNSEILTNGKIRTEESIIKLKKKIININNARQGVLDMCCKNPVNQKYDNNILQGFRELFPSIREIKEGGELKYLELSIEPVLEQSRGWQQLKPYHICKLTSSKLIPLGNYNTRFKAINLIEDCYTANCDNQDTLTLEGLLKEETNPIEYSYFDDLKMYQSIQEGNLDYIKKYLFKYNSINKVLTHDDLGNYIIHIVCKYYNKKIFDLIMAMRPNINVKNTFGKTPLHISCFNGHLDAINILIKNGAELNAKTSNGFTPLMMAVQFKDSESNKLNPMNDFRLSSVAIMIKSLIRSGADINSVNNDNETVLHIIIKKGKTSIHLSSITRMLMEYGVDVNIKDINGITALELTSKKLKKYNNNDNNDNNDDNVDNIDNIDNVKEKFTVKERKIKSLKDREIELKEIQTMLFNQIIRSNRDKYSSYINVSEIPKGAPIEVLNFVCNGDNPEIEGIEDKKKCETMGGIFTKVKNPTTKVKLELIPQSEKAIMAESEEELYYDKYPDSILERELPEEIKSINQKSKYNTIGNNMNSNNTKNINNDIYVDRDDMININKKHKSKSKFNNIENNNTINDKNKKHIKNKKNNMLLNNDTQHPELNNAKLISSSVSSAMNNSNQYMISVKSNISKIGFIENNKRFLKENILGILLILILIISLLCLYNL